MNLNNIAKRTYLSALDRGKISMVTDEDALDKETIRSLLEETTEVITADNGASPHIPQYSHREEELADVIIVCCTELYRRGVNIEDLLLKKVSFNEHRK